LKHKVNHMKKVLLAFDGTRFSMGAFEFARHLNDLEPILLTGVFLPQVDFSASWSYARGEGATFIPTVEPLVSEKIMENISAFESLCAQHGIDFTTHRHPYSLAIPELKKETRFADLMILGGAKFIESGDLSYLTEILHDAECPVLVVPERYSFPGQIILAYDGSASAAFSIKRFACLFPELCGLSTTLVYASNAARPIPDLDYIEELAARHFRNLDILKLRVDAQMEFNDWLKQRPDALLVSGSFARSAFSQIVKEGFSEDTINDHITPVFIAHK
jgi:nucleotide-binding universal stress UspA family protein